ncbi:MAG TPA: diphthamide synthesis protein [Candidatus Nanoarchaeia archaeon]|nr:diphthamide synthesis protein [Candidatus Nanoarchaeia archaeon]
MKVAFIEAKAYKSVTDGLERNLSELKGFPKIGLLTTVQWVSQLEDVKKLLQGKGITLVVGKPSGSAVLDGQVLGCDVSSALSVGNEVDAFLYIGTGNFHPFGLLANTEKPFFVYDPFTEKITQLSEEEKQKLWKRKVLRMANFKDARAVGILVSTKPGQHLFQAQVEKVKEKLEKEGKKVYLLIGDLITNTELRNFSHIQAWVNTACPRLMDDDFEKPIVNAADILNEA